MTLYVSLIGRAFIMPFIVAVYVFNKVFTLPS